MNILKYVQSVSIRNFYNSKFYYLSYHSDKEFSMNKFIVLYIEILNKYSFHFLSWQSLLIPQTSSFLPLWIPFKIGLITLCFINMMFMYSSSFFSSEFHIIVFLQKQFQVPFLYFMLRIVKYTFSLSNDNWQLITFWSYTHALKWIKTHRFSFV